MDLEKLKKFTALRAVPDQLLYSLLIWPDHSIPASYGPVYELVCSIHLTHFSVVLQGFHILVWCKDSTFARVPHFSVMLQGFQKAL